MFFGLGIKIKDIIDDQMRKQDYNEKISENLSRYCNKFM